MEHYSDYIITLLLCKTSTSQDSKATIVILSKHMAAIALLAWFSLILVVNIAQIAEDFQGQATNADD